MNGHPHPNNPVPKLDNIVLRRIRLSRSRCRGSVVLGRLTRKLRLAFLGSLAAPYAKYAVITVVMGISLP